ncbi:SDR family NAD(P)-dependent oxidoreductase [Erythrobacter sp. MTPC3]|uniref:SDR family NAD(P)-dependent oxidoreductase n=1 Tax=Erythrobacter sp. MTPC3 TaxID=3056564 RepID=UPI0036F3E570
MGTSLLGKAALVTGASKGIGRAIALGLAAQGAHVIAVARASDDLATLDDELGARGETWAEDASGDGFLERIATLSKLDILVNNLGTNRPKPLVEVSDDDLDVMLDLNLRSLYRITRASVPLMYEGAAIVNISSQMGHVGSPGRTVYCMTKHGVEGLTKALAVELAPQGIRVNSVAPTFIETPMTKPMLADPKFAEFVKNSIPLGKVGCVEDVAEAVIYLSSSASKMVTGHSLLVDGGWTAQ